MKITLIKNQRATTICDHFIKSKDGHSPSVAYRLGMHRHRVSLKGIIKKRNNSS